MLVLNNPHNLPVHFSYVHLGHGFMFQKQLERMSTYEPSEKYPGGPKH